MQNNRCLVCKNYVGELKCLAFPEEIPAIIIDDINDHSEPLPEQDDDIVFEKK